MAKKHPPHVRRFYATFLKVRNHIFRRYAQAASDGMGSLCFELTLPQLHTLCAIKEAGEVTVKEVAQASNVSAPSASAMIDRLVEMGMAVREHSTRDRREVLVRLSEKGRQAAASFEDEVTGVFADLLEKIGPEWAQNWCEVNERLERILSEEECGGGDSPAPSEGEHEDAKSRN